jgi:hypothetical protein
LHSGFGDVYYIGHLFGIMESGGRKINEQNEDESFGETGGEAGFVAGGGGT